MRKINDVWAGLRLAGLNFFFSIIATGFLISLIAEIDLSGTFKLFSLLLAPLLLVNSIIGSIFIYFANSRYKVDIENDTFKLPATDIENSILQIIILAPLWNLYRTKTIAISSIENMYLDTLKENSKKNRGKPRFRLNITGEFGSAQLEFLSRQKRDEVRSALSVAVKAKNKRNIDKKLAEFS